MYDRAKKIIAELQADFREKPTLAEVVMAFFLNEESRSALEQAKVFENSISTPISAKKEDKGYFVELIFCDARAPTQYFAISLYTGDMQMTVVSTLGCIKFSEGTVFETGDKPAIGPRRGYMTKLFDRLIVSLEALEAAKTGGAKPTKKTLTLRKRNQ